MATRKQLELTFSMNMLGAIGSTIGATAGGAGFIEKAINHSNTTFSVLLFALGSVGLTMNRISAMRTSHRLSALESTGRDAEPERPDGEASARPHGQHNG